MKLHVALAAISLWLTISSKAAEAVGPRPAEAVTPAPLYRDPVYDGAADPVLVWHPTRETWWMLYTQRRAKLNLPGVEWCHGTEIGVAESRDEGMSWTYLGILQLAAADPEYSFWAPDVIRDDAGRYHLFVSYVPGAASTHRNWGGQRHILHYSSDDLWQWNFERRIPLASDFCIDPTLIRRPDGAWRMWYKDEGHDSKTYAAESHDLKEWASVKDPGISKLYGEGPKAFRFQGTYWLIKDPNSGLDVYRSDDLENWTYQGKILDQPGNRNSDGTIGKHADVVVCGDRAYIIYFTHPYTEDAPERNGVSPLSNRHTAIQAAELEVRDGRLECDRNKPFRICLTPPGGSESARSTTGAVPAGPVVLNTGPLQQYVAAFNGLDRETATNHIPNVQAGEWLAANVPLFECPDKDLEEIYYFRWWTYRKHVKQTPDGFIITEFLPPVPWAGKHNSINCPAGHHFYEGRWLHDPRYLDDYAHFWFRKGGEPRKYSFWAADSIYARSLVLGDDRLPRELLPDLIANYAAWEQSHLDASGLFWQNDGNDGMEVSIGGSGCRATINSYQYGDAVAIAHIAERAGQPELAQTWRAKASALKQRVEEKLWDPEAQFFKVLPRGQSKLADVRELHGYTPWYVNLPDSDKSIAWKQLLDPKGFHAPFGPTTAEQRHPQFAVKYEGHECQWNGPSWPLATSVTLTALANLLNHYSQDVVGKADYWKTFQCYVRSHRFRQLPPNEGAASLDRVESRQPWIDENLNPFTGDWIARTLLKQRRQPPDERGKDYNHSTFCDLVITGLVGLRPRADDLIEVNPLLPEGAWDYFCLDHVRYHGRTLTILYDQTGTHFGKGRGFQVLVDGRAVARSDSLQRLTASLR